MDQIYQYTRNDEIATEFMWDIITMAMKIYNVTFDKLFDALETSGYWEGFNDTDLMVIGAHHGLDDVIKRIGELIA